MKSFLAYFFILISAMAAIGSEAKVEALGPLSIADKYQIISPILNETREFYVSLPKSYKSSQHQYPVLYLLDADQNMQHAVASTQLLAEWRGIPEVIIVGIPSTNRISDYTPSKDVGYSEKSGGGDKFMGFLKQELIPYIDKHYRTHSFRILSGHSLSGLLAANELMKASDDFNAFIITAPSLWWHDFEILKNAESNFKTNHQSEKAVYFGIGELDGFGMKQELQRFVDAIKASNSKNIRFDHKEYAREGHMSAPLSVTYDGLLFVFSDIPYEKENWDSFTSQSFIEREIMLKAKYGSTAIQTEETYVALGNYLLEHGNYSGAVTVFSANAKAYPGFAPNRDWLANAYVLAGDIDNAKKEYQKAYDLTLASVSGQGNADQYMDKLELLSKPIRIPEQKLQSFVGCYASEDATFDIFLENGKLFGNRTGWHDFELFAKGKNQFFMRVPPGYNFNFVDEESGKVLIVEAYGNQYRLPAKSQPCTETVENSK